MGVWSFYKIKVDDYTVIVKINNNSKEYYIIAPPTIAHRFSAVGEYRELFKTQYADLSFGEVLVKVFPSELII